MHSVLFEKDNKQEKIHLLKLIGSLSIIFACIGIGLYSFTYKLSEELTQNAAFNDAKIYVKALEEFRTLYTSEVVNIVKSQGITVTHNYRATEGAIPLPATLSMLLGQKISEQNDGASTRLYSPYPFPWRKDQGGLKDDFSKKAWQFLQENPDRDYSEFEQLDGASVLRYAKADVMAESCVDCHNSHPLTPKNDWKMGDVRGILEVTIPLEATTAYSKQALLSLFWIILAISLAGIFTISYFAIKIRRSTAIIEKSALVKEQLNHLNKMMAGVQELRPLSDNILKFLTPMLGANQAALFLLDKQAGLTLTGSYARTDRTLQNHYALGEGLVGQTAVNKTLTIIEHVPENYLQISSGLGSSIPCSLLLFPVLQDQIVVAVLEFASFKHYSRTQTEFLPQVEEAIALSLESAKTREITQQLLKTNQLNVLELKDQKQRLQFSNAELETQTRQLKQSEDELKCSEEELKVQSEELKASNEELEEQQQALTLQTEQLQQAKSSVEAKAEQLTLASKYKSEFLANMSHELRTPLNSMLILSKSLSENQQQNLTKEQVEEADIVYQGGQALLALINDIMDLSKVEAGMLNISCDEFLPGDVKYTLKALFTPIAENKNLHFDIDVDERLKQNISTDKHRLEQILKNFLGNAFKFTDSGSVKLEIKPAPDCLNTSLQNSVSFSVTDTGIGIDEDQQQQIFSAFQQADGGSNRKYGGTGLGLSISKELTQLLGGHISLISKPGMGSKFCLTLPLQRTDNQSPLTAVASNLKSVDCATLASAALSDSSIATDWLEDDRNTVTKSEHSLLLIEDDRAFSKILIDLIHSLNTKVIATNQGRDGLMLALEYAPTGILLDLGLPDINGLRVLEQLKDNMKTRHIPVHVISAGNNKMQSLHQGAISYLQKPADAQAITATLLEIYQSSESKIKRILVIEDNSYANEEIKHLIASDDTQLYFSSNISDACLQLSQQCFDCIIIDMELSQHGGTEIVKQISDQSGASGVPIIVYTGETITAPQYQLLNKFSSSIVIKGAESPERLLDDVTLFLHHVGNKYTDQQQQALNMLHDQDAMLKGRRVLVVDDDMRNMFALTRVLEQTGIEVVQAENGQVAVDILSAAEKPIELILMDMMMPVMDGYDATRQIRKMPLYHDTPIIALTAKAMPADRQQCIDAGACEYLTKPLDIDKVLSMLRIWLYRKTDD
ncbi:MAG: hypothetical protein OFPI_35460 [Osedax symbiont Rs2]|nr:MAG: hypothetical protein OFPI_35460 [Osedax symbiont Rs2]